VEAAIEDDVRDGTPAQAAVPYRRLYAGIERLIVAYQSRLLRKLQNATLNEQAPLDAHRVSPGRGGICQ
jgi:hypothetical protein